MGAVEQVSENIEKAVHFAIEHDLSIFPLNSEKKPMIKWGPLQKQRASDKEMEGWLRKDYFSDVEGIGLVTGPINGIVVLDIDVKKGKDGRKYIRDKHLPQTVMVKTENGGTHYYYKYPKGQNIRSVRGLYGDESGVDVKAEGGFVVTPFTQGYEWVEYFEFGTVELADVPEWLLTDLQNRPKKETNQTRKAAKTVDTTDKEVQVIETATPVGKDLKQHFKDTHAVMQMLPLLGLQDIEIGSNFNCILPTKDPDTNPSASLYKMKNGVIAYRDWRASDDESKYYMLPEVYASLKYKEKRKLSGAELATWGLRLLVDAGVLETKPIEAPELPVQLRKKKALNAVYEGFKHLLAVKKLYAECQNTTAFSYRFGAAWCGLSLRSVQNAMSQLEAFGYIQRAGKEGPGVRAVNVYRLNKQKP